MSVKKVKWVDNFEITKDMAMDLAPPLIVIYHCMQNQVMLG